MKKKEAKKQLKMQEAQLKKNKAIIKSYQKMIEEYEGIAKRMKKSLKKFENMLEEIALEESFTDEELDQLLSDHEEDTESKETDQ